MELNIEKIRKNLEEIKEDIKKYSPHPEKVKLVAVTKYFDESGNSAVKDAGHLVMGENKGQVIRDKEKFFREKGDNIEWHFIGNLQKNKVKYLTDYCYLIHSVNSIELAREIDKRAGASGRIQDILLEINIAGEESKEGYKLERLYKELPEYFLLKNIKIKGLMTMAPYTDNEHLLRGVFSQLRSMKDELNSQYFHGTLSELSMGMSGDYKVALSEGATIIRVGSKIFE